MCRAEEGKGLWGRRLSVNLGPQIFTWEGNEKKKRKKLLLMELVNICCSVPGCAPREVSEGRGGRENKMKENLLFCSFPLCKDTKQTNRGIRMRALCGC